MDLIKEEIKELVTQMNYIYENKYSNATLNDEINYYLFLCEKEDAIQTKYEKSVEEVLYSKYYWFSKFKNTYEMENGEDAGICQIQYKILEEIDQRLENGVDWEEIKAIENMVI